MLKILKLSYCIKLITIKKKLPTKYCKIKNKIKINFYYHIMTFISYMAIFKLIAKCSNCNKINMKAL